MKKFLLVLIAVLMITPVSFADDPSIWAVDFIEELEAYGEIRSDALKDFQDNITRSEFIYLSVMMIEIVNDQAIQVDPTIKFSDTNDIYALKGASAGITSGIGNGQFGPDMLLTREQMATLLINTLDQLGMTTISNASYEFVDNDDFSSWAKDAIYLVKANDIMSGVGNDKFDAKGYTKTEAALVVVTKLIRKNLHKIDSSFMNKTTTSDLQVPVKINDDIEVTMDKIVLSNKPSLNTLTFTYAQKNISTMSIAESSLRIFFSDGSSELVEGFSKYYGPGSSKIRTLSHDYAKYKTPMFVIVETDQVDINLNLMTMPKWTIK